MSQVQFENHVEELKAERDNLLKTQQKVESENSTLRRDLSSKEQDSKKRQSTLEERIRELVREDHGVAKTAKKLFIELLLKRW